MSTQFSSRFKWLLLGILMAVMVCIGLLFFLWWWKKPLFWSLDKMAEFKPSDQLTISTLPTQAVLPFPSTNSLGIQTGEKIPSSLVPTSHFTAMD